LFTYKSVPVIFEPPCITFLYMFRAITWSSSGGQIVYVQHLLTSLSISGRGDSAVHRLREDSHPEDEHIIAPNMYRNVILCEKRNSVH